MILTHKNLKMIHRTLRRIPTKNIRIFNFPATHGSHRTGFRDLFRTPYPNFPLGKNFQLLRVFSTEKTEVIINAFQANQKVNYCFKDLQELRELLDQPVPEKKDDYFDLYSLSNGVKVFNTIKFYTKEFVNHQLNSNLEHHKDFELFGKDEELSKTHLITHALELSRNPKIGLEKLTNVLRSLLQVFGYIHPEVLALIEEKTKRQLTFFRSEIKDIEAFLKTVGLYLAHYNDLQDMLTQAQFDENEVAGAQGDGLQKAGGLDGSEKMTFEEIFDFYFEEIKISLPCFSSSEQVETLLNIIKICTENEGLEEPLAEFYQIFEKNLPGTVLDCQDLPELLAIYSNLMIMAGTGRVKQLNPYFERKFWDLRSENNSLDILIETLWFFGKAKLPSSEFWDYASSIFEQNSKILMKGQIEKIATGFSQSFKGTDELWIALANRLAVILEAEGGIAEELNLNLSILKMFVKMGLGGAEPIERCFESLCDIEDSENIDNQLIKDVAFLVFYGDDDVEYLEDLESFLDEIIDHIDHEAQQEVAKLVAFALKNPSDADVRTVGNGRLRKQLLKMLKD